MSTKKIAKAAIAIGVNEVFITAFLKAAKQHPRGSNEYETALRLLRQNAKHEEQAVEANFKKWGLL